MSNSKFNGLASEHEQWERWEMQSFELPQLENQHHSPEEPAPELDAASILAEIQDAKQAAIKQGYDEGYAKAYSEGLEKGTIEGHTQAKAAGFKEGHAQGLSEGHAEGAIKAQQEAQRLTDLVSATQSTLAHIHEDMGQALLSLAVNIASHVLQNTLHSEPERILDLIKQLLHVDPDGDNPLTLYLNPLDCELVSRYLHNNDNTKNWRIVENAEITVGGCKARTALGDIDATLETRWRRTISTLKLNSDLNKLLSPSSTLEA